MINIFSSGDSNSTTHRLFKGGGAQTQTLYP